MKIYSILCLSIAIVLPEIAVAKLPPNPAFGQLEGTIDYCAQADAPSAAKYQDLKKRLVEDVQEKEVAEARKTKEYKESRTVWSIRSTWPKSPGNRKAFGANISLEVLGPRLYG